MGCRGLSRKAARGTDAPRRCNRWCGLLRGSVQDSGCQPMDFDRAGCVAMGCAGAAGPASCASVPRFANVLCTAQRDVPLILQLASRGAPMCTIGFGVRCARRIYMWRSSVQRRNRLACANLFANAAELMRVQLFGIRYETILHETTIEATKSANSKLPNSKLPNSNLPNRNRARIYVIGIQKSVDKSLTSNSKGEGVRRR